VTFSSALVTSSLALVTFSSALATLFSSSLTVGWANDQNEPENDKKENIKE
jgi:hypothetical protein